MTIFSSTIVRVETDERLAGHGEVCPIEPFYLPASAEACARGCANSDRI